MIAFTKTVRRAIVVTGSALALGGGIAAHAADVYWSVGVQAPGMVMSVGAPPVVVAPAPVAVWGYGPPQAYYGPPAVVYSPAYRAGWDYPQRHHKHWKHERHGHEYRGQRGWDERYRR